MPQQLFQFSYSLFVSILRGQVYFGHNNEERNFQKEAQSDMFFSHFLHTHIGSNNNSPEIWWQTCKPVNCSFKIFLMPTKIDQWNYLVTLCGNLFPIFIFVLVEPLREYLFSFCIEAHNLLTNWACSSCLLLMEIIQNSHTSRTVSIVFNTLC